jgi:hypothetical protein
LSSVSYGVSSKRVFGDYSVCTKTYFTSIGAAKLSSGKFPLSL